MVSKIKNLLYFPIASYFRFFATIRLKRWNPRIIVITGSSGKTTLFNLVESQVGDLARYSHEANSSFGIPFDILGSRRHTLEVWEWPGIILAPLVNVFKPLPKERIYIVEADCDRPYEGKFLSSFIKPEVTLWTNVSRTHSMNFEKEVENGNFESVDKAISYEFGFFAEKTKKLVIGNINYGLLAEELKRASCDVVSVSQKDLEKYRVGLRGTEFHTTSGVFKFEYLLPEEVGYSVIMCMKLLAYLKIKPDNTFKNFKLPPGRNSFFKGIRGITIVDSSYNANLDSMRAVLNMFNKIDAPKKWAVLGDMLEQGGQEEGEHKKLAELISGIKLKKIILMGPRVSKYTYPVLKKNTGTEIVKFVNPKDVLDYLKKEIKGGEVILFKGARFMEGVIENLLADKKDAARLSRREKVWEIRRKQWGL